jgi:hypothetical protein
VDPVLDPLLLRKSGRAGNRIRDLWICSQKLLLSKQQLNTDFAVLAREDEEEELYVLGYNAVQSVESTRRFGGTCRLHLQGSRVSHARNQHEVGSKLPKTSDDIQRTTRQYIPEDRSLHDHRCEYLKSCCLKFYKRKIPLKNLHILSKLSCTSSCVHQVDISDCRKLNITSLGSLQWHNMRTTFHQNPAVLALRYVHRDTTRYTQLQELYKIMETLQLLHTLSTIDH